MAVAAPADARLASRLQHALVLVLAFFLVTLPDVEAPKNIAAVLYIVVWMANAAITRELGGRWNRYDTAFAVVLGSALVSGLAGYAGTFGDVIRVLFVSWLISRSSLREGDIRTLMVAACVGLLLGIPFALFHLLRGTKEFFELPSVGQVNQTALYLAPMAAAAFGWWLQLARTGLRSRMRTGMAVCATVFWGCLVLSASRGAIVAAGVADAAIVAGILIGARAAELRQLAVRAAVTLGVVLGIVAGMTALAPQLSDHKLEPDRIFTTYSMFSRMEHWRIAYEGWRKRPWLGWGPDSFQRISVDQVCAWRAERGEGCDRTKYVSTTHAHSLYMATLCERGLLGAAALLLLFATWGGSLLRSVRSAAVAPMWVASASGLAVVVVGGIFNTSMRVEHGSIALGFFALWIAVHGRAPARASAAG